MNRKTRIFLYIITFLLFFFLSIFGNEIAMVISWMVLFFLRTICISVFEKD